MAQTYRTARGKELDMLKLAKQNEMTIAVGNAKVNARGDKLGPGGVVVQRREEIVSDASGSAIPNQINIRPTEAPTKPAPVVIPKKNVKDMDPEGNE
jgi:hypothetical protein